MSKKCEIKCCRDCPYLDYVYYTYDGTCHLLNDKKVINDIDIISEIHPECPLEEWEENKTDRSLK